MPPFPIAAANRLNHVSACLQMTVETLEIMSRTLKPPFLDAIAATTQSLLQSVQLMESTRELLNAIIIVHTKSDTGGELPPTVLNGIAQFRETLHKIHTFVEVQQNVNKIHKFFRQGEINTLLKDCKAGLQQGLDFFQVSNIVRALKVIDIAEMQDDAWNRHQEVLNMVGAISDRTSDGESSISRFYANSRNR
ncbi:hypothetical protein B0H19DRAFT_1067706 [Mycena capillaripes]|nr:hypothetical protein B0H19DRAFT_1067706 [Mycena capillaripes]